MNTKTLRKWINSIAMIGIAISISALAWVQWQGVKVERNKIALEAYINMRSEFPDDPMKAYRIHMFKFLEAGFSLSEVLEHLYSMPYLEKEVIETWGALANPKETK